jgi:hypothetical protein
MPVADIDDELRHAHDDGSQLSTMTCGTLTTTRRSCRR